jgi:hypothetical protein
MDYGSFNCNSFANASSGYMGMDGDGPSLLVSTPVTRAAMFRARLRADNGFAARAHAFHDAPRTA